MPVLHPIADPETGSIRQVEHYTVPEMAAMFGTTRESVYRRVSDGRWPAIKSTRRVLFSPEHVRTIIAAAERNASRTGKAAPVLPMAAGDGRG